MKLSNLDLKKFSRQIIIKKIGINGQKKINNSKILIIGMGGLGCPLLIYLANSGVKNIGIVDDDKITISNLNRQILFGEKDVGKYKVLVAKKKLKLMTNKIKLKVFKVKVNKYNIKTILKNYQIICDGTDNFKTRYLINDYCKKMKKILITAAINKFNGQLFKFDFKKNCPCFRCYMPEMPDNELNCEIEGITPPVAGMLSNLQANEVLRTILELKPNSNGNVFIFDGEQVSLRKAKIMKNNKCINKC
tara:strand:+ start:84 stop:827 length:744 start_codon:yes stop_codon:yes gene_type:complete